MNACKAKRKLIMELALEALGPAEERALRAHLESCSGCRDYLSELLSLSARLRLGQTPSDIDATEAFHENVMRAVRGVRNAERGVQNADYGVSRWPFSWRVAAPVVGGLVAVLVMVLLLLRPVPPPQAPVPSQGQASWSLEATLPPSVANYRIAANRSLDQLDELLTRQAKRRRAEAPVFTASVLAANGKLSE